MVEKQFQTNMFSVFCVYSFRRFNRNRELIPNCWSIHRESTLANIQLTFRNNSCLEPDDLRVLEISEKFSGLTKYVGFLIEKVRYVTVANLNLIR